MAGVDRGLTRARAQAAERTHKSTEGDGGAAFKTFSKASARLKKAEKRASKARI
jgi:hypothetical protein